jgi:exodeoxyribonuclease V alpha subunit
MPDALPAPGQASPLRPLDLALARFLAAQDPAAPPELALLGALLSRQLGEGHICLDLAALDALAAGGDWPQEWNALLAPGLDGWRRRLRASPLAAEAGDLLADPGAPLVLDGSRLYLRRYWRHEREIAQAIAARLARPPAAPPRLAAELARLFPVAAGGETDWQKIACAIAARGAFAVITGGPGTGKTTTVVRLLGLLQTLSMQGDGAAPGRRLRIRLAAPTGKAAARLNASIAAQVATLDVDEAVRAAIPAEVTTLHRLLGGRPDTRRFRHDRANPLHVDVLVIDEASMIDLELMAAVLAALPAEARLVLLGDKDQLASVEAGAVLGELCRRAEAGHYDAATAAWVAEVCGADLGAYVRADARPLDQQVAMLRHSHRFGAGSGIGRLAHAVNHGDAAAARTLLGGGHGDLAWLDAGPQDAALARLAVEGSADGTPAATGGYRHYLERLRGERPAADAGEAAHDTWARRVLEAWNGFQLLCALREGPAGVAQLNRRVAEALFAEGLIETAHGWYEGRPVMVERNDYGLGLMNGDVGIALRLPGEDGRPRLRVAFPVAARPGAAERAGGIRYVLPSRLGEVQTVYAMTVHKSQGSEFAHTALALPEQPGPVLTRELLYTAVTRARERFSLVGRWPVADYAIGQCTRRASGLLEP